jgi:hypothetical protein
MHEAPPSDHAPLLSITGPGGRAALPVLFAHVSDSQGLLELLDRALAGGGTVEFLRDGDWLIWPA